jgi:hypothetical protein
LGLKERAYTSPPEVVESFDQVFNDFKASYFAGALMMPRQMMLTDIEHFLSQTTWQPDLLRALLEKYEATPEMLFYRLSELIPQHFGVDLHFLRFNDAGGRYRLVKQLNMNRLPLPSGFGLNEHYCRRWLTVRLLHERETKTGLVDGVQISEFLNSRDRFLCFGFSRPLALEPDVRTSVTLGFRLTPTLHNTIRFLDDPEIPMAVLNDTCERCPLTWEQCKVRAVEPTVWQRQQERAARQNALRSLMAELHA